MSGGLNRFAYALNHPVKYSDETGLNPAGGAVVVGAGVVALRICMKMPACKKAVKEAIDACKDVRCELKREGPNHFFPGKGWCEHYRLTCWIKGRKGGRKNNNLFEVQWPVPFGKCTRLKHGKGGPITTSNDRDRPSREILFPSDPVWELSGNYSANQFFENISGFGSLGRLFINVADPPGEVAKLYEAFATIHVVLDEEFSRGLIMGNRYLVEPNRDFLRQLRKLSARKHHSEIAEDLVFFEKNVWLDATGFCHEAMHISTSIAESEVSRFALSLEVDMCKRSAVFGTGGLWGIQTETS